MWHGKKTISGIRTNCPEISGQIFFRSNFSPEYDLWNIRTLDYWVFTLILSYLWLVQPPLYPALHSFCCCSVKRGALSELKLIFSELYVTCLCVCSMLLNNPKQRCMAETALLSPFFSIPFGMCQYLTHLGRITHLSVFWCIIFNYILLCVLAPHIEELVLLPSPVLRLINLIDDSHLHNDEEYEGNVFSIYIFTLG